MQRSTGILIALAMLAQVTAPPARAAAPRYEAQVINPDLVGASVVNTNEGSIVLAWGSDATILRAADGATWRHALTSGSADLAQLASNSRGTVMVAVGAAGTLLRSVDMGRSWQARKSGVASDLLTVVNAGDTRIWIAAGAEGRILRSIDDGKTWSLVESGLDVTLRALTFDAATGQILIGGDAGLIGASRDRGESWDVTSIVMPEPATPISGFHRFGQQLIATSAMGRFLVSDDDADSWDLLQASTPAFFTGAAFDPDHGVLVLAGHNGDLLRSTDSGRNWQSAEVMIAGRKRFLSGIRHDARSRSLQVSGPGLFARSDDGGATWSASGPDLRGELRGLVADESRKRLYTFGSGGQIASSDDSGANWRYMREPLEHAIREILAAPGGALLAASRLGDVLRSTDGGESWRDVTPDYPNPNTPPDLRGLLLAPSGEALIAVGPPGVILRAPADGSEWKIKVWTDIEAERAYPWMLVDRKRNLLVAVEARGAMLASRDDGQMWEQSSLPVLLPPGNLPYWQGTIKESNGVVLVAGEAGKAARSTDGARTWSLMDTGTKENLYGSYSDEPTGAMYLMGANGSLLRSGDDGASWTSVPTGSTQELRRMVREPRGNALLCFGARGTLLRSEDGTSWRAIITGTEGVLRKFLIEPRSGQLWLAGGQGALLRSADGRTWEKLDAHTNRHFTSLAAVQSSGDLVAAGDRIVRLVRQSPR